MSDKLSNAMAGLESGGDLAGYAALAAANQLAANWRDALQDGAKLEQLLPDIDDVIALLQNFKKQLEK